MNNLLNVLFDLDGTLIDTAPDLAYALNETRRIHDMEPIEYTKIRQVVSLGGIAMIKLAFNIDRDDQEFSNIRDEFLTIYSKNIHIHSRLFEGMEQVISTLEKKGLKWGIVTNKPEWLTTPLLQSMSLDYRAHCIVSGDTLPYMKPHPEPLFHACRQLNCKPQESVYVGDAKRDIDAGIAAGMETIIASYGYIDDDEDINGWGASSIIANPADLLTWLENRTG
jgi:N-acetyl-D-muramate 6-phosphate phosphatase